MTPHPQHPFSQQQVPNAPAAQGQQPTPSNQPPIESSQPQAPPPAPPPQESAPPAPFSSIEQHADANNDGWGTASDEKWINSFPSVDFGNNFGSGLQDFSASNFGIVGEDDIINYGDFLNEDGGVQLDMGIWEDLGGTEA
jgi:hypothetical protein